MTNRFETAPPEGVTPEPGVYTFGLDEDKRKALNFAPGLMSYTKLSRHDEPDRKIGKFVAGVGNLVSDTLLFGSEAVLGRYHFTHDIDKRTAIGKAEFAQVERDNPGMVIIRPREAAEAQRLIEVALANPEVKDFLNAPGYCEAGVVADIDGIRFRSWLDKLTRKAVGDLKTTQAATPEEFLDSALKYKYDAQAGLYVDQCEAIGLGQLTAVWLVISKTSNRAWIQELPAWAYWAGRRWRDSVIRSLKREQALRALIKETD